VRRFLIPLLALTLAASGLLIGGAAQPASAEAFHNSSLKATSALRLCIDTRDASCAGYKSLPEKTTVAMRCWWDGYNSSGVKTRFFWIDTVGSTAGQGFVAANLVGNQWLSSPWCGNDRAIKAIQWAGRHYKENYLPQLCLTYVWRAYWYGANTDKGGHDSAKSYWQNYPRVWDMTGDGAVAYGTKQPTRTNFNPPLGSFAFWDSGTFGHVALSIGDGIVLSTQRTATGATSLVHLFRVNTAPSGYAGWIRF
jgi:hypothetical protein